MKRDRRSQLAHRQYHVTTKMCTLRLLQPDQADTPVDSNGLALFSETRNLVSALVPSSFNPAIPYIVTSWNQDAWYIITYNYFIQHIDNRTKCNCCGFLYSEGQQTFCIGEGLTYSFDINNLQRQGLNHFQSPFTGVRYYAVVDILTVFVIIISIIFAIQSVFIEDFMRNSFLAKNFSV
jgi:hypothetical protein